MASLVRAYGALMRYVEHMGTTQWLVVAFALILFGIFCMRGFGSRSGY